MDDKLSVKDVVKELLLSVKREGMKEFVTTLEKHTDYFTAPASTKYHLNCEGGLLQHHFNVFSALADCNERLKLGIPKDTIIITGLLHDACKVFRYIRDGDEWVFNPEHKDKGHSLLSIERIKKFIPLTPEEEQMIKFHMGLFGAKECVEAGGEYSVSEMHEAIKEFRTVQVLASCDMMATIMEDREDTVKSFDCLTHMLKKEKTDADLKQEPLPLPNMNGMEVLSSDDVPVHYAIIKMGGQVYSTKFGDMSAGSAKLQFVKTKSIGFENNFWFKGEFVEGANHKPRAGVPFELNVYTGARRKKDAPPLKVVKSVGDKEFSFRGCFELVKAHDKGDGVPFENIINYYTLQGKTEDEVLKLIMKMQEAGELFENKAGRYKVLE
ncbi:hypothetical protein ACFL96_14065 [Thermoproteota archaeon]